MTVSFRTSHIDSRNGSLFVVERSINFDAWTGSYRDSNNDVFVCRPFERKLWVVSSREPGNQTKTHSRHRNLAAALAAAADVVRVRCKDVSCARHDGEVAREVLDGEPLCQSCCDVWARSEAAASVEG